MSLLLYVITFAFCVHLTFLVKFSSAFVCSGVWAERFNTMRSFIDTACCISDTRILSDTKGCEYRLDMFNIFDSAYYSSREVPISGNSCPIQPGPTSMPSDILILNSLTIV